MAPRKKKTTHESESDSNSSIGVNEQLEQPGDTAYVAPRARAPRTSSSARPYGLRNHSQVQRPVRSRGAALTSTNRLSVHPQPAFNHELARFIPWKTLLPGHKGPIPSEMAYAEYVAEREHKQKNRDNEPSNQEIEVVFRPTHKNGEPSSGPTVAHLSHKSPKQDPLRNLYTADANPGIADNTKFHPPSDQYSYRNEYDPMFSLDAFDEETVEGQHKLERRKTAYVDWASLSDGVKFAVVYDLVQDYGFTGTTRVLSLSVDEIISFKKLYRGEKAKCDAFDARIADEVHSTTQRRPNQSVEPFPRASPDALPAPALHLVTDSLGKEDVATGRRFLKFMGMSKYANAFSKWYGCCDKFYEMPEVLNIDLDFLEEISHSYSGFDLQFPSTGTQPEPRNDGNSQSSHSPLRCPPSPSMPDPLAGSHWPPIIDKSYSPDAMDLADRAFRGFRNPLDPSEGPGTKHGQRRDWNAPGLGLGLVIFDPAEKIRIEAAEELRRKMNPASVTINGNADEKRRNLAMAGYRLATVKDLARTVEGTSTGFKFAKDPGDFVPYGNDPAVLYNGKDFPDELLQVNESDFLHDFDHDPPAPNNGSGHANEQRTRPASASGSRYNVDYDI